MTPELEYPFPTLPAPGETIEVAPGVHWIRMTLPFALNHINLWLLDDGDRVVVIDCGYASPDTQDAWDAVLALPGTHLHLYGKLQPKAGRKMGHLNITGATPEAVRAVALQAAALLGIEAWSA